MTALGATTAALVLLGALAGRPVAARRVPAVPEARARRRDVGARHRRAPAPEATLPELVDLLAVAADAGLPVGPAVASVAPWAPPPWAPALARCTSATADGELLHDALGHLTALDPQAAGPLVAVLRAGLEDGDRLAPGLGRLAADARDARRRRAEEAARALPVRSLLPLVGCSLPAFVVLTIVPILAAALEGLRLPDTP